MKLSLAPALLLGCGLLAAEPALPSTPAAGAAPASAAPSAARFPLTAEDRLPDTDGFGLLPKADPPTRLALIWAYLTRKSACDRNCATPFGTLLGEADGVPALSNCRPTCIDRDAAFMDLNTGEVSVHKDNPQRDHLRFTGMTYQCVEYARRWWMKNRGLAFGSVGGAYEILYLAEAEEIRSQARIPLARSVNGTALRPPRDGDLLVWYPDPVVREWRWGHVAVVTGVDLERGVVELAEQNLANAPWEDPDDYARRIRLFEIGGRWRLVDVPPEGHRNPSGGRIAGWVYPAADE